MSDDAASPTRALTFPGQGSQAVGMGVALAERFPEARAVLDAVDDALGEKLSALMADGPEDALTLTRNAQPALMAVSIATLRDRSDDRKPADQPGAFVAGHSLGSIPPRGRRDAEIADAARLLGCAAKQCRLPSWAKRHGRPAGRRSGRCQVLRGRRGGGRRGLRYRKRQRDWTGCGQRVESDC